MLRKYITGTCITIVMVLFYHGLVLSQPKADHSSGININTEEESVSDTVSNADDRKLIAYFLHGRKQCMSCRTIEAYAHDAIQTYYAALLENGQIEWLKRNYANPEYAHFKDEFELYTQSVVLVDMQGEKIIRWKNLKDVWTLTRDKKAFYDYIRREVESYLNEE